MSAKPPVEVTLMSMYERLAKTMDGLLDGSMTAENANAMANASNAAANFVKLELQMIDLALSNDREVAGTGFLPAIDGEAKPAALPRLKSVGGSR